MKRFKLIVFSIIILMISFNVSIMNVDAKEKKPYLWKQTAIAKNTSNVMSSYALYDNEISLSFKHLQPNTKYKIYRKEAKKAWKVVKTFFVDVEMEETDPEEGSYDYVDESGIYYSVWYDDTYHFTDRRVKSNTRYYYKLYSCGTKKYSNIESYWTAVKHPKKFKQSGNIVTWDKVKGTSGYLIWYRKHFSFLDGYYEDNVYYCKIISKEKTSYILPNGCKIKGVYAFTKHGGRYYLNWSGIHKTQGSMKTYVKNGILDLVIKKKIRN